MQKNFENFTGPLASGTLHSKNYTFLQKKGYTFGQHLFHEAFPIFFLTFDYLYFIQKIMLPTPLLLNVGSSEASSATSFLE